MITSAHNPRIKWVRQLQSSSKHRREAGAFVIEGVRLAEEALAAGWEAQLVLHTVDLPARAQAVVDALGRGGAPTETVTPEVMKAAGDTETPQGVLAVLSTRALPLPEQLDFVLVADAVRDPGNLGTMIRSAAAAGMQAVFCPPETADAFAPKVVRAGMGAHFRLPVLHLEWDEISERLADMQVYLAAAGEGPAYDQVDLTQRLAFIVGGEAQGAGQAARQLALSPVHIPMPGGSESLNAAVAAAVLIFEAVRQRRAS